MNSTLEALKDQQEKLEELLGDANQLLKLRRDSLHDADRVNYTFVGDAIFAQGDSNARDVVFTVPDSSDFVVERIGLYPSFRFVTTDEAANGPPEESFRPCIFAFYEGSYNEDLSVDAASMDCYVSLSETFERNGQPVNRAYQNIPTPIQLLFCGAVNYRRGGDASAGQFDPYYSSFQFPGGYVFPCTYLLPAGGSLTIKIAPLFAGLRSDPAEPGFDPTLQNEYKVIAVLEGYKKVRR